MDLSKYQIGMIVQQLFGFRVMFSGVWDRVGINCRAMSEGAVRFQRTTTATGRLQLKAEVPCAWDTFPDRAGAVARTLGLTMIEAIDGPDCRLAIAGRGDAVFCISWDDWLDELTVIPWRDTSDGALEALLARATNDGPS